MTSTEDTCRIRLALFSFSFSISYSPQIVGILNVTPDSYYDGGQWKGIDGALQRAEQMLAEGADWIEVGGESTGPASADVTLSDEIDRTIPVIRALRKRFPDAHIAIDTYKSAVAKAAIEEGALMVNDVTAGRADDVMFSVVAAHQDVSYVLMYSKDSTPRTTIDARSYADVVSTIRNLLQERSDAALAAGVSGDRIILDPGLGHFVSSDAQCSYEIIARLQEFSALGYPLFVSPSRKSFLAGVEQLPTGDRLPGTMAASAIAVLHGASYIRTHDVLDVRRACQTACEILQNMHQE